MTQENNTVRSNVGDGNEYGDDGVDVGTRVIVFVTLDCLYSLLSRRRFVIYCILIFILIIVGLIPYIL